MKGYEIIKQLTEEERNNLPSIIQNHMEQTYDNTSSFIICGFAWDETKQGVRYWAHIYEKYQELEENPFIIKKTVKRFGL
jgi:hypothetical protein